jgi:hypothetical protein
VGQTGAEQLHRRQIPRQAHLCLAEVELRIYPRVVRQGQGESPSRLRPVLPHPAPHRALTPLEPVLGHRTLLDPVGRVPPLARRPCSCSSHPSITPALGPALDTPAGAAAGTPTAPGPPVPAGSSADCTGTPAPAPSLLLLPESASSGYAQSQPP